MKSAIRVLLAMAVGTLLTSQAVAQSLGVNFLGRNATTAVNATETAGVVAQPNWVPVPGEPFAGTSASLTDSTGAFTGAKLIYDCNDSWSSDGPTITANDRLMKGIMKANPNPDDDDSVGGTSYIYFTFTNLTAGSTYDVIAYMTHNGAGAQANLELNGTTYYVTQQAAFAGTFIQGTATSSATRTLANYVRWNDVAAQADGTLQIVANKVLVPDSGDGIGVAGIQLIKKTGTWTVNTDMPVITTEPPSGILGIVGDPITLAVGTDGLWNVQWLRNGTTPIGTGNPLNYVTTAADKGASIIARVSNNVGSVDSTAVVLDLDDPAPEQLTRGLLKGSHYGGITGVATTDLYNNARYLANDPDYIFYPAGGNVPQTSPDLNDFGRQMEGYLVPTSSGAHDLFIRSDDASDLYFNSVAGTGAGSIPDPRGFITPVASEPGCCNAFQEPRANQTTFLPINLTAGSYYGVTMVYKEGTGGDYMQLAWRVGTTPPAGQLIPISPDNVYCWASPAGQRATITTQPVDTTVVEPLSATFTLDVATEPTAGVFAVQWMKDGVNIAGATGSSYTTPATTAGQGAVYSAKVYTLTGVLTTDAAQLTVLPDTIPPVPSAGALVSNDGTTIDVGVGFDEPVNDVTARTQSNYSLSAGTVSGFTYSPSSKSALLKVTGLNVGDSAVVTVINVTDLKGNAITSADAPFTVPENLQWGIVGGAELGPEGNYVIPVGEGAFDVFSNGMTEWASYDEATFVYEEVTGDFDKKVNVVFQDQSSQWARAGLIVREDLSVIGMDRATAEGGGAGRYQKVHANPVGPTLTGPGTAGNNTYETNRRLTLGGATDAPGSATPVNYPDAWVRLQREGDVVRMYWGENGRDWNLIAETTFDPVLPETVYVGPEFSPENGNITNEADRGTWLAKMRSYSDTFSVTPEQPVIGSISVSDGNVTITWTGGGELQSATTLTSPTWTGTGNSSGSYTAPVPDGNTFYRVAN